MAQPTAYNRVYDFDAFQTSNPTTPLPSTQVSAELNAVETTVDGICTNLAIIQRDDTKLANEAVHKDAFDSDALALMGGSWTPKGDWATSTAYSVSDVVEEGGSSYVCVTAHTSGTFSTDRDTNNYWIIVANPGLSAGSVFFERISGDGAKGPFTLSVNLGTDEKQIFVIGPSNGTSKVLDPVADYTINGTALTFTANTTSGTNNYIIWSVSSTALSASAAATTAKTAAETAKTGAETAQTAAETARDAAVVAKTAAETALDNFDDIYLGAKSSDPSVDNDGDALTAGDLYFNTSANQLKVWSGSAWIGIGANTDETSKVSSNDTTAGFLNGKLVAGSNITFTENNNGSNETMTIAATYTGVGLGMVLALG